MDSNSPEAFFRELPPITRGVLTGTFCVTLFAILGVFNPTYLLLDWILVVKKFHLWRLFTDYFFIGPFSVGWIFQMYFFVSFSGKLEKHQAFSSRLIGPGGYLYFLALQMIALDILSLLFYYPRGKPVLGSALTFSIIYYWSKKEAFAPVSLWGFTLTSWQLPYALLVLDVLLGQSLLHDLMGLGTGHLYHFVRDVLPIERNIHLLNKTPSIFGIISEKFDFYSSTLSRSSGTSSGPTGGYSGTSNQPNTSASRFSTLFNSTGGSATNNSGTHHFPGRGYRLGADSQFIGPSEGT